MYPPVLTSRLSYRQSCRESTGMWEALFSPSVASWCFRPFASCPRVLPLLSRDFPWEVSSLLLILAPLTGPRVGWGEGREEVALDAVSRTPGTALPFTAKLASPSTTPKGIGSEASLCLHSHLPVPHSLGLLICISPGRETQGEKGALSFHKYLLDRLGDESLFIVIHKLKTERTVL